MLLSAMRPAIAEEPVSLTATATFTTDYRFRGVSQNARVPAAQGNLDLTGPDGWYGGGFASKVDFADHENTALELVLYGGKRLDWHGTTFDVSLNYYGYPDHHPKPGSSRYSSFEGIASVSRTWDALTLSGTAAWSPEYFGGGPAWYVAGTASYRMNDWLTASATLGEQGSRTWGDTPGSGYPYTHWDAGVTATFGGLSFDARYGGASLSERACLLTQGGRDWCASALVLSVSYRMTLAGGGHESP